jgi:hypothetical protein
LPAQESLNYRLTSPLKIPGNKTWRLSLRIDGLSFALDSNFTPPIFIIGIKETCVYFALFVFILAFLSAKNHEVGMKEP